MQPEAQLIAGQVPEAQLVRACLAGDADSVVSLINRFQERVFRLAWRMLGDRHEAEDVTQETFVRALRGLGGWDNSRSFEPWLLAIAANRCRTQLAKRRLPLVDCPAAALDVADAPDDRLADRQIVEEIDRALAELRTEYAAAFRLFHQQHLAYSDIANELGVPLGTIKTWVHRARREVADRLLARGVVDGPTETTYSRTTRSGDALPRHRNPAQPIAG